MIEPAGGTSTQRGRGVGRAHRGEARDLVGRAAEAGAPQQMRGRARAERSVVRLQRRGEIGATLRAQDAADVDLSLGGHCYYYAPAPGPPSRFRAGLTGL